MTTKDYTTVELDSLGTAYALYWYDRTWRAWGVAYHLASGDQVGEAEWHYAKADAIKAAEFLGATRRCQIGKLRAAG